MYSYVHLYMYVYVEELLYICTSVNLYVYASALTYIYVWVLHSTTPIPFILYQSFDLDCTKADSPRASRARTLVGRMVFEPSKTFL